MLRPTTKPKQRQFLDTLIDQINHGLTRADILKFLRVLKRELRNRPAIKRAPAGADPITPTKRQAVRNLHRRYPRMRNRDIGYALNIDSGRVSEILAGKRH